MLAGLVGFQKRPAPRRFVACPRVANLDHQEEPNTYHGPGHRQESRMRSQQIGHENEIQISNFVVRACFLKKYIFKMAIFTERKIKNVSHLLVCEKPRVRLRTLDAHLGKQKFYIIILDVHRPQGLKNTLFVTAGQPTRGGFMSGRNNTLDSALFFLLVGPF